MPYCPKCGKETTPDAKFCLNCGSSLGTVTPAAGAPVIAPTPSGWMPPFPLSDIGARIVAGLVDYIIIGIIGVVLFFVAFAPFFAVRSSMWTTGGPMSVPFPMWGWGWFGGLFLLEFLLWLIYFTYFEGSSGQTIGKRLMHIKVVKENGAKCDYGSALVRNLLRIIDHLPTLYILGIILIAVTDKKQRLGDMLAKTIVVKA